MIRRISRFCLSLGCLAALSLTPAAAQSIRMQEATLAGAANIVTLSRVPVVLPNGTVVYRDVQLTFRAAPNGTLSVSNTRITPAPTLLADNFRPGKYVAGANNEFAIDVSGPGVGPGGSTQWSLSLSRGANSCTLFTSGSWTAGPLERNPVAARVRAAKITPGGYSFGIVSTNNCNFGLGWPSAATALVGVAQTGNNLTFASFTNSSGRDTATPVAQATFTLR